MSSAADQALATLNGFNSLFLEGKTLQSDVAEILQEANVSRTIEGASTLTLELYDDTNKLLNSGLFKQQLVVKVGEFSFEIVQVRKSGPALTVVMEDLPVAALRRHDKPLKVGANTLTHIDFAERLVKEEPWLSFETPAKFRSSEKTKVELTRGQPAVEATATEAIPEDSWAALGRIAEERGWRRYVLNNSTIAYTPETALFEQASSYTLREGSKGVESINFDFDTGKTIATLSARVRAARWEVPIGTVVTVEGLGPADGEWLVTQTSRSLFSLFTDVSLEKPRPVLPEPEASAVSVVSYAGGSTVGAASAIGQQTWPDDPADLVKIGQGGHRLASAAAASFRRVEIALGMQNPSGQRVQITISDSYRSTAVQGVAFLGDRAKFGKASDSAHVEGRAVDVDLRAMGANPQGEPTNWLNDSTYRRIVNAFESEGWCNYQLKNGTSKGRTREPWHFSYQVCK
jgi:hypothetical protein